MNAGKMKLTILIATVVLLLSACGTAPTPIPPTETAIPPTATAVPPTATVEPETKMPVLSYGTDSWEVVSIDACGTIHTSPFDTPDSLFSTFDGALIRLIVNCTTGKPLFPLMQEFGGSPFQAAYLTDANDQQYPSFSVGGGGLDSCETNYVIFSAVPQDQNKLTLHFLDAAPIELPEPTYEEDCPYQ